MENGRTRICSSPTFSPVGLVLSSPNITEREQARTNLAIELKGEGKTPAEPEFGRPDAAAWTRFAARPATAGLMVEEQHTMIRFVPDVDGGNTDASYHLPAFYELFACWVRGRIVTFGPGPRT